MKKLIITANYYGTLAEQIQNIKQQYGEQLDGGGAAMDEEIVAVIEAERDQKIADIKANFEDREHVEEKILSLKEQALDLYLKSRETTKERLFKAI